LGFRSRETRDEEISQNKRKRTITEILFASYLVADDAVDDGVEKEGLSVRS